MDYQADGEAAQSRCVFSLSDPEDHLRRIIAPTGNELVGTDEFGCSVLPGQALYEDRVEEDGPLFPTQSGKIELYSAVLNDLHFDPMPVYHAPEQPPSGYLRLIYGRGYPMHSFDRSQNNAWLDDLMPENQVWVSTKNGASCG